MRKFKILLIFAMIVVTMVSFTSCSRAAIKQLKDQSLVQGIGIDWSDEGEYEVTLQVFDISKSGSSTEDTKGAITTTYSATGRTVADAIANSQKVLDRETFLAQNKLIVLGEEIAKDKLEPVLDYFIRAENCRPDVQMAMTKGKAKEIIEAKCKDAIIPAEKIQKTLINGEYNGKNVNCLVKDVVNSYLHPASDIFLPAVKMVEEGEEKNVSLDGVAVFSQNKLSGYVDEIAVRSVLWANDKIKNGLVVFETEKLGSVSLKIISSKTKEKVEVENGEIVYSLDIKVKMDIDEIAQGLTTAITPEGVEELGKIVSKEIEKQIESTLDTCLKGHQSDVFQIGRMISIKEYDFYNSIKDDYHSKLPFVKHNTKVDCMISRVDNEIVNKK